MRKTVIKELEDDIRAQKNLVRVLRTNCEQPEVLQREIDRQEAIIRKAQQRISDLRHSLDNRVSLLVDAEDHLKEMRQDLVLEKNRAKVEALIKLQGRIDEELEDD